MSAKRNYLILLSLLLCMCFGCGKKSDGETLYNPTAIDIMASVITSSDIAAPYTCHATLSIDCKTLLQRFYSFDENTINTISDIMIVRTDGVSSEEYVIIKTSDVNNTKALLEKHLNVRLGDFAGYAPDEEEKLGNACIVTKGNYVGLFVSKDSSACKNAFTKCLTEPLALSGDALALKSNLISISSTAIVSSEEEKTTEVTTEKTTEATTEKTTEVTTELTTEEPYASSENDTEATEEITTEPILVEEIYWADPYDTSLILEAYKTGNKKLLTDPLDIAVLEKCKEIISRFIRPTMTDYEKERVIHDYIVQTADYDENAFIYSDWFTQYADQPYGTLINKDAICLGYTTTFKLLLNMLDIECIVVKGTVYDGGFYHTWNLVKLDNRWYAVDITWDDPVNQHIISHKYFNVSDDYLIANSHHLSGDYPPAIGGPYEGPLDD